MHPSHSQSSLLTYGEVVDKFDEDFGDKFYGDDEEGHSRQEPSTSAAGELQEPKPPRRKSMNENDVSNDPSPTDEDMIVEEGLNVIKYNSKPEGGDTPDTPKAVDEVEPIMPT